MKTYDVIVVGAGPAGIMATYQLSRAGLDVLLIDKGEKIKRRHCPALEKGIKCAKCPTCHLISGFGGAGLFSDGKIILSDKIGGNLKITQNDYSEIEAFIKKFHRNAVVKDTYSSELIDCQSKNPLSLSSPDVLIIKSNFGNPAVYKFFSIILSSI